MRADAARNREAVLRAAGRLFDAADDPDQVSMGDVADAAGVGKGTLFRRFGDRAALVRALFEERAERMHASLELDRDGPAADNVAHVMSALLRFKIENRALTRALENAGQGSPYSNSGYDHWHTLLADALSTVHAPEAADFLAHALLAAVRSDLVEHLSDWPEERLQTGLAVLVRSVLRD